MTPKQERLRKAYEFKIGKDRTSKLSDQQISLLSKYYNGLSEREQQTIDSALFQGRTCEITEMADAFISESKDNVGGGVSIYKPGDKFEDNMKEFAKGQEEKLEETNWKQDFPNRKRKCGHKSTPWPLIGKSSPPPSTLPPTHFADLLSVRISAQK